MPKGISQRAELAPLVREMRETMKLREISEALGIPQSTLSEWCSDPDRIKHAARRMRYAGKCESCGKSTDGSYGPGKASPICSFCSTKNLVRNTQMASKLLREELEIYWREKVPLAEIAFMLEYKPKSLQSFISSLRREGYDFPYRRTLSDDGLAKMRASAKMAREHK
jgi:hypothetical protein